MIRILTDSMSDLTQEDASRLGITVLPMPVRFGEEERWEGVDLSREEFFARLRMAEELPHTSQIAPRAWQKAFDRELRDSEYFGCHPCINTSSLRLRTKDLLEVIIPAMGHEPHFVTL